MNRLVAHLNALKIWIFYGGRQRFFLFLTSVPVLWMFWGICSPSLVSGTIDLKSTFLSLFSAWYALSYLQEFTNNDTTLGLSGTFYLPTCPALPISPLMRTVAELIFFYIISILLFLPLLCFHLIFALPPGEQDLSTGAFIQSAIQGTLAITPIVFSTRMNVNGTFFLPATLRTALPIILCGAFFLFHITGLFSIWLWTAALSVIQIIVLSAIFMWLRGKNNAFRSKIWSKYFSRYVIDNSVFHFLLGKNAYRTPRAMDAQIVVDIGKIIILYLIYWVCFYFPLLAVMYYLFINVLDKPVMSWFFLLLLLILPTQDNHALKDRFILPTLLLPVRRDRVIRWFYFLFSLGIVVLWTIPLLVSSFFNAKDYVSLLPSILFFAPTIAGVWVNRIYKKPLFAFAGVVLLCCLPIGYYFNIVQTTPLAFLLCAVIGAILPIKSLTL